MSLIRSIYRFCNKHEYTYILNEWKNKFEVFQVCTCVLCFIPEWILLYIFFYSMLLFYLSVKKTLLGRSSIQFWELFIHSVNLFTIDDIYITTYQTIRCIYIFSAIFFYLFLSYFLFTHSFHIEISVKKLTRYTRYLSYIRVILFIYIYIYNCGYPTIAKKRIYITSNAWTETLENPREMITYLIECIYIRENTWENISPCFKHELNTRM